MTVTRGIWRSTIYSVTETSVRGTNLRLWCRLGLSALVSLRVLIISYALQDRCDRGSDPGYSGARVRCRLASRVCTGIRSLECTLPWQRRNRRVVDSVCSMDLSVPTASTSLCLLTGRDPSRALIYCRPAVWSGW